MAGEKDMEYLDAGFATWLVISVIVALAVAAKVWTDVAVAIGLAAAGIAVLFIGGGLLFWVTGYLVIEVPTKAKQWTNAEDQTEGDG